MEVFGIDNQGYRPVSLSWQSMFQKLKDYHDLGHKKGPIPASIVRWMSMQQRQYRVYGIGLKEPVGVIKHRVKKLNELGFEWNPSLEASPMEMEDESEEEEEEVEEEEETHHRTRSSTRRRGSDASQPMEALPVEQVKTPRQEYSGSVKGITRSGNGKRWQVRTNTKTGKHRERVYLGSYDTHAEAVEALRIFKATNINPFQNQVAKPKPKPAPAPKKKKVQKKKWKVNLNHNGEQIYIGSYDSHAEAAEALRKAKQKLQLPERPARTKGVTCPKGRRWEVRASVNGGKRKYIGSYATEAEAIAALHKAQGTSASDMKAGKESKTKKPKSVDSPAAPSSTGRLRTPSRRVQKNVQEEDDVENQDADESQPIGSQPIKSQNTPSPRTASSESEPTAHSSSESKPTVHKKSSKHKFKKRPLKPGQVRGMSQRKNNGKWEVRCYVKGERKYIGVYNTREEALKALREANADDVSIGDEEVPKDEEESGEAEDEETNVDTNKTDVDSEADDTTDGEIEVSKTPKNKSYFPLVLYKMINDSSASTPEILQWLPCGSAFKVNDYDSIGDVLLGKYFRSSQYSSFHRMLNMYGFAKQLCGKYEGAFKHPHFHRDRSTEDTILARVVKR